MDATIAEQIASLRGADEDVRKRLADVDEHLSSWLVEVEGVRTALLDASDLLGAVERAKRATSDETPAADVVETSVPDVSDEAVAPEPITVEAPRAETDEPVAVEAETVEPAAFEAQAEPAESIADASPTDVAPETEPASEQRASRLFATSTPVEAVERETPVAPTPAEKGNKTSAEDEQLLAELAPDVAAAIRVKRRLTGGRKSVRELLEEMQGGPTTKSNEGNNSRWWRRRNG